MKNLFAFLLLFVFTISVYSADITSVKGGGLWSNPQSWEGGKVPTADDNVIIDGKITVDIAGVCYKISVLPNCFLVIDNKDIVLKPQFLTNDGTLIVKNGTLNISGETIDGKSPLINNGKIENEGIIEIGE